MNISVLQEFRAAQEEQRKTKKNEKTEETRKTNKIVYALCLFCFFGISNLLIMNSEPVKNFKIVLSAFAKLSKNDIQGIKLSCRPLLAKENNYWCNYLTGMANMSENNYIEAEQAFSLALEIQKNSLNLHRMRGFSRAFIGDYAGAIEDFSFVIENASNAPESYYGRAFSSFRMKKDMKYILQDLASAKRLYNKLGDNGQIEKINKFQAFLLASSSLSGDIISRKV